MKTKFITHGYGFGINDLILTTIDGEKGYQFPKTGYTADLYLMEIEDGQRFPIIHRMGSDVGSFCVEFETKIEGDGKYEWRSIDLVELQKNGKFVLINTSNNKMNHPGYKSVDERL